MQTPVDPFTISRQTSQDQPRASVGVSKTDLLSFQGKLHKIHSLQPTASVSVSKAALLSFQGTLHKIHSLQPTA